MAGLGSQDRAGSSEECGVVNEMGRAKVRADTKVDLAGVLVCLKGLRDTCEACVLAHCSCIRVVWESRCTGREGCPARTALSTVIQTCEKTRRFRIVDIAKDGARSLTYGE